LLPALARHHSTIFRGPRDRMRRSDLVARTDCEPSAAGLSRGSRHGHQWETICPLDLCGRTAWRCRQPSFAPHPPMPQAARQVRPGQIPGVLIQPGGHSLLQADLVCASRGQAALLSCKERKSRFLLLAKAQSRTAAALGEGLVPRLCEISPDLRKTLTLDNGSEMAGFRGLESATGLRTYFCWPHSPWQRGSNLRRRCSSRQLIG